MPERVNSFGSMISGAIFMSLVITISFDGPVKAESPCIEHPPEPVAEVIHPSVRHDYPVCFFCYATATEVLLWNFRYDPANGRKCWFLSNVFGRDVTEEHVRGAGAPRPTIWSRLSSAFDNFSFTGVSTKTTGDVPPSNPEDLVRKRQVNATNASRPDDSIRISQKSSGEAGAAKQISKVSLQSAEQGLAEQGRLYEDFVRWREAQDLIKMPDQRKEPSLKELGLYEEFLRWSTPDPPRSMRPLMGKTQL